MESVVSELLYCSKKNFDELENFHTELMCYIDPESGKYVEEENWFFEAEKSYIELVKQVNEYLDRMKPPSSLNPTADPFKPEVIEHGLASRPTEEPPEPPPDEEMERFLGALRLLAAEISPFDGDVRRFHSFLAAFDARIGSQVTSDLDLLYYLDQHLRGRLKNLISCYLHLPPKEGYAQARALLVKECGDAYRISMAYLQELDDARPVKNEDIDSLCTFSLLLLKCQCAMASYTDLSVLNHPHTMQGIASNLCI